MFFKFKSKKRKNTRIEDKQLREKIQQEFNEYLKRGELQEYLEKIKKDERKKKLWDSLSARKKIKLLRYVLEQKGGEHGGK
ncbi:hypothetical protein LCGC14_0340920 [marine sediment metagenome]|uniref:Uncharacterized protein n=1 Tax=marine sediment metagenome TaxID=412755 RepID=A0A0F9TDL3_9ZZZZ